LGDAYNASGDPNNKVAAQTCRFPPPVHELLYFLQQHVVAAGNMSHIGCHGDCPRPLGNNETR